MNSHTEAAVRAQFMRSSAYAVARSQPKHHDRESNWSALTRCSTDGGLAIVSNILKPQPIALVAYQRLKSGKFHSNESFSLIEDFVSQAYEHHSEKAEEWTSELLELMEGWESRVELLSALTDFSVIPQTLRLTTVIEDLALDDHGLVFIAAVQLMVRAKIPTETLEKRLPEKRREALKKLQIQFP